MPIYPYSFQLPPLNVQDIPNDGAPGEFLGINVGGALDWLPAGGGGSGDMLAANNLSELTNFATARTNIGLGTASTPTFANLTLTSPSLSSSAPVTISQTWNNAAVAFTGLKFNAAGTSDANSASGSLLADFQLNGGSLFKVQKNGRTTFSTSTGVIFKINEVSGSISGDSSNSFGTVFINGDQAGGGASVVSLGGGGAEGVTCRSSGFFAFSSSSNNALHANRDTILLRDGAANTLALRNGAAAQTFRVYNTYTDASNYERVRMNWVSDTFAIFAEASGTGTQRNINIGGTTTALWSGSALTRRWNVNASGHFTAEADNTYDIGASTGNRPRDIFLTGTLYSNTIRDSTTGVLSFVTTGSTRMTITGTGNVGIGTTSPTSKLHVVGDGLITGTLGIGDTGTSLKQFVIAGQPISNSLYLSSPMYIGLNAPIIALMNGGVRSAMWDRLTGITLTASSYYGFNSHETDGAFAADTILRRDGEPYHLATRNGTNGQKFSVYGTYPGAAWERFTITAPTSGNVLLGTYKGTGGIARGLEFQTDGVTRLTIQATTGAASFSSDITPGANRYIRFINNTAIHTTDVGVLNVLDVGGFNVNARITLGGSTSSFPALKRSTTSLQARLADDSAFTNIQGKLTTDTAFDATVVTPTGFITLYDSTGTAYKVPCVPA